MLSNKKILVVSIYPILNAQHGGQKRVKAFVDFYRTLYKEVRYISVFYEPDYPEYNQAIDFPVTDAGIIKRIQKNSVIADYIIGQAVYDDVLVREKIKALLEEYRPNVVEFEQSFPFPGLKRILNESNYKGKLVFNSQNIEGKMKRHILKELGQSSDGLEQYLKDIEHDEKQASRQSDLVLASSSADAKIHKKFGAKRVVYIRNGIEKITPTLAAKAHWKKFKQDNGIEKLVTYVGSAHPPNLTGFKKMVGFDLNFLDSKAHFMIAGGVSQYMQGYIAQNNEYEKFWDHASPLGRLSDDNLAGLITESDVIILPITTGGGSNLKTAEAIASGKKIVATSFAFRSFEEYAAASRIAVTDKPTVFRNKINDMLALPSISLSPRQKHNASKVYWHELLNEVRFKLELNLSDNSLKTTALYATNRLSSLTRKLLRRVKARLAS